MSSPQERSGLLATAVGRPVAVVVGALLVCMFGLLSVVDLPIQLTPDVTTPTLTVRTDWPGASPTEVESEILEPQEDALKDVTGLERMIAEARPDSAQLTLEFAIGTEIDQALVRVSNALTEVPDYPEAADEPLLQTADASGPPLAVIAVRSENGEPVERYRTWLQDRVLPELQRIEGVGDIGLRGGRDRVYRIDFDPHQLAGRGISVSQLADRIRSELRDVSGGDVTAGRRELRVRTMAVEPNAEDLESIVVGADEDGQPVRLRDIGGAAIGYREATAVAMSDDRPSIVLLLNRETGSNVLEVTRAIRETTERLDAELFRPEGLRIEVVSDQIEYIEGALELVRQNLIVGAILAIAVLWLFLRSLGASAIVSVSIPVCAFGTLLGLTLLGRSINVVSLAGITFAIGMVLDNSIVSLEAIDVWRRRVTDSAEAALRGVSEVWGALFASTATTAAVFVPVLGWEGQVGQLLQDIAVAITFAIGTSLLVSVLVIPALAARLPPRKNRSGDDDVGRLARSIARFGGALARSWWRSLVVVSIAVLGSVAVTWALLPPLEYLPPGNRNLLAGILTPPPGASVEELEQVGRRVQAQVREHTQVEKDGVPPVARSFFVGSPDQVFAGIVAEDAQTLPAIRPWLQSVHRSIPGFSAFTAQPSIFGNISGGRSIEIDLQGTDLGELTLVGRRLIEEISARVPGAQIRPLPNLDAGALELRAHPRREEAAAMRMTTDALGQAVDAMVDGTIVGKLGPRGERQVDVMVRAKQADGTHFDDAQALRAAPVVTPSGHAVPLGVLAEFSEELGPTIIRRTERRRALTLVVAPPDEVALETSIGIVRDAVEDLRAQGELPAWLTTNITGTAGDLEEAKGDFAVVLLIALIISYLLMSALFEDFLAPIVVLLTVPMAAAGGTAALVLVDELTTTRAPLDLLTAVGFLILIGVVVNNAILVVDGARSRLREGDDLDQAVSEAVASRVRPIFMTTATSLAGLLPMVVSPGAGSELYRGVGAIVLGGLALSTVLTLFVIPAFFVLLWRIRMRARRLA